MWTKLQLLVYARNLNLTSMERNLYHQVCAKVQSATDALAKAAADSDAGRDQISQKELINVIRRYDAK